MTIEMFLLHPMVQALGWSLLHFLWQGALLALALGMFLWIAPASAARRRYAAAASALLLMPAMLAITVLRGFVPRTPPIATAPPLYLSPSLPLGGILIAPAPSHPGIGISGWAVGLWLLGVLLLSVRAAGGWMRAQRLTRRVGPTTAGLEQMLDTLKRRLRVSAPVRLCASALVEVPTVIGWLRPYILLPVTALTGLNDSQIAAILAHELAHIRRHDYIVNLLQTVIETVFFYHPCVWWVSKQIRQEREHCCDDIAVAIAGSPAEYAAALAELEQIRGAELALAATGGDLLHRIRRVLGQPPSQSRVSSSLGTLAAAIVVLSLAFAPSVHSQAQTPAPVPAPKPASKQTQPQTAAAPQPPPAPRPEPRPAPAGLIRDLISADSTQAPEIAQALAQAQIQVSQLNGLLADNAPERTPEERAKIVDLLIRLYDSEKSSDMKASILSYMALEGDKRASDKLLSIAQSDPNEEMRLAALSFIARSENSFDTLASLYDHQTNDDMRMALLSYIGLSNDPRATDKLMSIVQSNAHDDVRQAALSFLVRK